MRALARVFVGLVMIAAPVQGQGLCIDSIPGMSDGLAYYDRLDVLFTRLDSAFRVKLSSGTARLEPDLATRFDLHRDRARAAFERIADARVAPHTGEALFEDIGAYPDFIAEGLGVSIDSLPEDIERLICPLRTAYLLTSIDRVEEHGRRLAVRYGPGSESLNLIEMLLNEWTTSRAAMGALRDPSHWEWIARTQILGYQYERRAGKLVPSFPVVQLGLSYYLFGTGTLSRRLNHVGLAGAYQRDGTNHRNLVGFVLHVQDFDIGVLCERRCRDHVVVASKNFTLLGSTWKALRQAAVR